VSRENTQRGEGVFNWTLILKDRNETQSYRLSDQRERRERAALLRKMDSSPRSGQGRRRRKTVVPKKSCRGLVTKKSKKSLDRGGYGLKLHWIESERGKNSDGNGTSRCLGELGTGGSGRISLNTWPRGSIESKSGEEISAIVCAKGKASSSLGYKLTPEVDAGEKAGINQPNESPRKRGSVDESNQKKGSFAKGSKKGESLSRLREIFFVRRNWPESRQGAICEAR